jgi:hypothetical protein
MRCAHQWKKNEHNWIRGAEEERKEQLYGESGAAGKEEKEKRKAREAEVTAEGSGTRG